MEFIISTAIIIFLVMDPFGNMPFFISSLSAVPKKRWKKVILRETSIALLVLCLFLLCGKYALIVFNISQGSVGMAGGVILLLIALKMVFQTNKETQELKDEPFIVPLAVPMLAGPTALATIILLQSRADASMLACFAGVIIAWILTTVILIFSEKIAAVLGSRTLDAGQSLMGLLLAAIAIEMIVKGIKLSFYS